MRSIIFQAVLTVVFFAVFTAITSADTLIYDNSFFELGGYNGYYDGYLTEFLDYGTSAGGLISKFKFDYWTESSTVGTIVVRFYRYTDYYDSGYPIKTFVITDAPATGGYIDTYEYVIPEDNRFELPSGDFGYSFEVTRSTTYITTASGGQGNENYFWLYDEWYYDFIRTYFTNGWSGFSMQVYSAPPIDEVTCDIKGYKFDDTNADGNWDEAEPGLPHWEMYIDENEDGVYQVTEPNAVTDPNGMYFFENLDAPATITIREIAKNGWTQTLPGGGMNYEYVIDAEPNTLYTGYHFGNTTQAFTAFISGKVFYDADADSEYDPGESGQSSWRIYIDANQNSRYDTGENYTLTNASGEYLLTVTAPGTYNLAEEMKSGYVQTYPTDACTYTVTIDTPDQLVEDMDFGNYPFLEYGGGSGTEADPYLISSPLHLQALGAHNWDWGQHFKMTNDIALTKYKGREFNLIGRYNYSGMVIPFSGTFDGDGHYIGAFTYHYTDMSQEFIGLFGYVHGENAEIRNLKLYLSDVHVQGAGIDSGALVGRLRSGTVSDCFAGMGTVKTESTGAGAGGLVGQCDDGILLNCHATLDADSAKSSAGGLIAYSTNGTVTDCSAEGTVSGHMGVGGLVGENHGQISRCHALADVTGFQYTGGLVGENRGDGTGEGSISLCYAQGTVQTVDDDTYGLDGNQAGGLVGRNINGGTITNCYSHVDVTGDNMIGGLIGSISGQACIIEYSYAVGSVNSFSNAGGLIGAYFDGTVTGCVWDTQTSGQASSDGGIGKTTWQMQNAGTFDFLGWDLVTPVWNVCPAVGYPVLAWQQCQPGPGGVTLKWEVREGEKRWPDFGRKVLVDGDGNLVVMSQSYIEHPTGNNYDFRISKYTPDGEYLWAQTLDSDPNERISDDPVDMAVDAAGNIYVTGNIRRNILTIKYSPDGTMLWDRVYDADEEDENNYHYVRQIALDAAGNVYLAAEAWDASTGDDFCLVKYDNDGVFQWDDIVDGGDQGHDSVDGLVVDSQGFIYIAGDADDDTYPVMILKYNTDGVLQWQEFYDSPPDKYYTIYEIDIDQSDNIYLAGILIDSTDDDFLLLKCNTAGDLVWTAIFDLECEDQGYTFMALDEPGNIYLAGVHNTPAAGDDYLVVKFSSDGDYQWHQTYNGPTNQEDGANAFAVDGDGNVYVSGISDYYREGYQIKGGRAATLKYDTNGNLVWSAVYDGLQGEMELPESIAVSPASGDVYVTGQFEGTWLMPDVRVLCYTDCSYPGDADVDYKVGLADFAVLGRQWLDMDCDECQKGDWTGDGSVLLDDVLVVAENWLQGMRPGFCDYCSADVALPAGVGLEDFAVLSGCWGPISAESSIADLNHDKHIDLADTAKICDHWLMGR